MSLKIQYNMSYWRKVNRKYVVGSGGATIAAAADDITGLEFTSSLGRPHFH